MVAGRWVGALGACAVLVAACGSQPRSPSATGTVDTNATVRMAAAEDTWPVQGQGVKSTTFAYPLNVNVFEPLIYLASDYTLKPGLAESWELVPPSTWRFHLRRGVKFHDGKELTADDVMWSWAERQQQGQTLSTVTSTLGPNSVIKVDDRTVDFTPKTLNLRLPEQIVHPEGAIVERGKNFDSLPDGGTGPFTVSTYRPGESVELNRFEAYWGTKPNAKQLSVRFLPDPQTRVQALRSGQVDFVIDVTPTAVKSLGAAGYRVVLAKPGKNYLIYINKTGKAPHELGADPAVREAVSRAIDRKAFVSTVFEGNADPGRWMAPESVLGKSAEVVKPIPFEPSKSQSVLDQAGWSKGGDGIRVKNGRRLSLSMIGPPEITSVAFQFLQAAFKKVGIDSDYRVAADTATFNNYYRNTDFDVDIEPPNQNDGNPAFLPVLRMYSKSPNTDRFAPGGSFDEWAAKALVSTSREDVQAASAQMMKMLIDDQYIVVPLAGVRRIYAMKSTVNLGDPHPSQTNQTWFSLAAYGTR
jgi:peptide/nickel transport system substrate-binding protein